MSQQIADYVGCIRATGATVASDNSRSLSAAAGAAGVTASTQADVKDKLEKRYATVSDTNAQEIIHDCYAKTSAPNVELDIAGDWETTYTNPSGPETTTRIHFVQNGASVTGSYGSGGRYEGALQGRKLKGLWNNGGTGSFEFQFSDDGRSFKGHWGLGGSGQPFDQRGSRL